jgi:C-terminal processing protease CtpA/Prc
MASELDWRRDVETQMFARALVLIALMMAAAPARAADAEAERTFTAAEVRADFAALYDGLKQAQFDAFAHTPKAELDRAYKADFVSFDRPMSLFDVQVRFQRFTARIRIAHARIEFPSAAYDRYRAGGGKAFPLYVRVEDGHAFIIENGSGLDAVAVGDELVALDGAPVQTWLARAARNVSADTPYLSNSILEFDLPQYLWLERGLADAFAVRVRKADGRVVDLTVPGRTRDELHAAQAKRPKTYLDDADKREARVLAGGVGYLRPGPFYNPEPGADMWDPTAFKAFIDKSFQGFLDAKVGTVLIDLRENPGGDNSFSDPMIAWFADKPFRFFSHFWVRVSPQTVASNQARIETSKGADAVSRHMAELYAKAEPGGVVDLDLPWAYPRQGARFTGKVYLLVNRHSFSNTVNVAALVQDYGFGKVLGEETSDMATTYGAMEQFKLPITGITVGYPKAHIIRVNGDPVSRGVVPDLAIRTPIVAGERDEVLDQALAIIARERP